MKRLLIGLAVLLLSVCCSHAFAAHARPYIDTGGVSGKIQNETRSQKGRKEIDLILENGQKQLVGIEYKSGSNVDGNDFKHLRDLQTKMPEQFVSGIVIYTGAKVVSFGKNLWAVPSPLVWGEGL